MSVRVSDDMHAGPLQSLGLAGHTAGMSSVIRTCTSAISYKSFDYFIVSHDSYYRDLSIMVMLRHCFPCVYCDDYVQFVCFLFLFLS